MPTRRNSARRSSSPRSSAGRSSGRRRTSSRRSSGRKYGRKASQEVRTEMRHMRSRKHKVKNRKQAIAIGLSKARRKGAKVPSRNQSRRAA